MKRKISGTPGSQADLVRHFEHVHGLKITKQAISKLVKAGDYRIFFSEKGKIIIEPTAKALLDSGFPSSNNRKLATEKKKIKEEEEFYEKLNSALESDDFSALEGGGEITLNSSRSAIEK